MLNIFFKELFYVLTGAIIIFAILEIFWPRLVLAYFNLNWLLILWLIVGIVLLGFKNKKEKYE
ncbi:MAG: hypothetical protein ABH830_00290 [Patescibacteria group bacterium]